MLSVNMDDVMQVVSNIQNPPARSPGVWPEDGASCVSFGSWTQSSSFKITAPPTTSGPS